MAEEVKNWLLEAGEVIKARLQNPLIVETKSSRTDLVTNVDKETETFIVSKIRQAYPTDQILGEEGLGDVVTSTAGRLWIIDPIDGTLNFVKQHENFCIMVAFFEEGIGKLGFIYDVMRSEFYWGGKDLGVYQGTSKLPAIPDVALADGLVGMNAYMYRANQCKGQEIANASSGVRMIGCAGIEFIQLLRGNQVAYLSYLAPWDYAAGIVLAQELGLISSQLSGAPLSLLKKELFVCATPATYANIQQITS